MGYNYPTLKKKKHLLQSKPNKIKYLWILMNGNAFHMCSKECNVVRRNNGGMVPMEFVL